MQEREQGKNGMEESWMLKIEWLEGPKNPVEPRDCKI